MEIEDSQDSLEEAASKRLWQILSRVYKYKVQQLQFVNPSILIQVLGRVLH
jgi:hypothetical protein